MSPEKQHKIGIEGVVRAKRALEQLLRGAIDLPFNAYDNPEKLEFADPDGGTFSFDLGGQLRREKPTALIGPETCELLVEVKNYSVGSPLLPEYRDFLRRASIAASEKRHATSWFLFLCNVPFGTNLGTKMCDGSTLADCAQAWSAKTPAPPPQFHERVVLCFWTASTERLLTEWKAS